MGEIVVDPARLAQTARELTRAGERLSGVSRQLARTSAGAVGDDGLAAALDGFSDDWRHGLGLLGDAAAVTGDRLAEAARAYSGVDGAIAQACG